MISFLIPFRDDGVIEDGISWRKMLYDYITNRIKSWVEVNNVHAEILTASNVLGSMFDRAGTRNILAQKARGDVFVFVDADSIVSFDKLLELIEWLTGKYATDEWHFPLCGWGFPYNLYYNLTKESTKAQLFLEELIEPFTYEYLFPSETHPEASVGGIVGVTRKAFELVGGYDERFLGWGEEDRAFSMALATLVGNPISISGPLYHLWHPVPEESRFDQPHFEDNRVLCNRYRRANGRREEMRMLVKEPGRKRVALVQHLSMN